MRIVILILITLNALQPLVFSAESSEIAAPLKLKHDPFIPLVDSTGRVKSETELVRPAEIFLPLNISLKGIIWSKVSPLAIINNKIYREGDKIFEGLILEKINPDNVILNDRGEKVKIYLRKKEKK